METMDLGRKPIKQGAKEARARREGIAAEFREQLVVDLKFVEQPSAAQRALLAAAVSAYVETCELSAAFLRGNASPKQLTALGLARGQLTRTLRLLGLAGEPEAADSPDSPPVGATPEECREWAARYVSNAFAEGPTP